MHSSLTERRPSCRRSPPSPGQSVDRTSCGRRRSSLGLSVDGLLSLSWMEAFLDFHWMEYVSFMVFSFFSSHFHKILM